MLFNSWQFALFFPVVTACFFLLPHRARWAWLLGASCFFYAFFIPKYLLILAFTIAVDYGAGLAMDRVPQRFRKAVLVGSIATNLTTLATFKYVNFFSENLHQLAAFLGWNLPLWTLAWALPIGLSFHVFQSLSYTIEVYLGRQAPERHLGVFALYVMFYPQLVAGPIERPQNLLPQFHAPQAWDGERVHRGLLRMLWGLFKKVVVADRLALVVNPVFAHVEHFTGLQLALAVFCFAFQIYCDFSGYSDVALGSAEVMGFKLMENFKRPYLSQSLAEFWRRWHVSLSTWFRDYVYIPLGGNQVGEARQNLNLLLVFVLSGLWHGANWTFLVWGLLHGVALGVERSARGLLGLSPKAQPAGGWRAWPRVACVFAFVCLAWVFFRANSIHDAWYVVTHLHEGLLWQLGSKQQLGLTLEALGRRNLGLGLASIAVLLLAERTMAPQPQPPTAPLPLAWLWANGLALALVLFGVYENLAFIYFQF